jgi:hypothetical protein
VDFYLTGLDTALDVVVFMEGCTSKGISLEGFHDQGSEAAGDLASVECDVNFP